MATLYFYGLDDNSRRSWQTASYWKTSDSPSGTASATIPASGDTVVIRRRVTNVPATLNLNSITIDIPQNKTYPTSDYGLPIVEFGNCTNLTTTSGINVIWNNNIVSTDYESNAFAYFGTPASGTYNTSFNFNFHNKTFFEDYNSTVFHRSFNSTTTPTNLLFNGNISITGIPTSGSYMPIYNGQFIHNSGNLTLQNVSTLYVFGSLACRRTGNTGYTIYASGCRFADPTASSSFYGGIPNDGTKRLQCSSATFNDCRAYTINNLNNVYYFGSGVQSINIDSTPYNDKIWPNQSLPYLNINTSGSTNVFFTNTNNALITHTIANTGNISLVNSALKSLYWKPTILKGNNSYLYLDGTSKIDNTVYNSTNIEYISISGFTIVNQYPNNYPTLASGDYIISYSGYPSPRTLYFNNAMNDNNAFTLGNWWNDSNYTIAATELPYPIDNVVVSGVQIAEADFINFNQLVAYDGSIDLSSSGIFCVGSGGATLNGSSNIIDAQLMRTFNGLTLNNTSYINGSNLETLGIFGSGSFNANDDSKFLGDTSKIYLNTSWNGFDGWDENDSIYYLGGRATSLDSNGTGWDANSNTYYINAVITTLDSNGSGFWNGHAYSGGNLQPNGWNGYYFYFNDVQTTLDSDGSGFWDGHAYLYGSQQPTGWNNYYYYVDDIETTLDSNGYGSWNGLFYSSYPTLFTGFDYYYYSGYYIEGIYTTLDSNGSGFWEGHAYYYGSQQPTGWNDFYYYIDDVETTLDSGGNGSWDGYTWVNGVRQVVGSIFIGANVPGDWYDISNWIDSNNYTATELPNSSTDVVVRADINTAVSDPSVNSLVVENNANISITMYVTTTSTFNDSSQLSGIGTHYSSNVFFNDSSSAVGVTFSIGSIVFNNNSSCSNIHLDPTRVYLEGGYFGITGFPIDPASLNISNDTLNGTNYTSFSRAGLGVNGSNILGLI